MEINAGATAWVLISAGLVLFMTPGLAFFYGGMVRSKNVLGMLMQNVFAMGLISVLWAIVGFSLAFGGTNRWIGNFDYSFLKDVVGDVTKAGNISGYGGALVVPGMASPTGQYRCRPRRCHAALIQRRLGSLPGSDLSLQIQRCVSCQG